VPSSDRCGVYQSISFILTLTYLYEIVSVVPKCQTKQTCVYFNLQLRYLQGEYQSAIDIYDSQVRNM